MRLHQYGGRVLTAWYLWVLLFAVLAIIVTVVVVSKTRAARARERIPQYRRQVPTE